MQRKPIIQEYQKVTADDYDAFGQFPRDSFDDLVRDAVDSGNKYVGFNTIQSSPAVVTVGNGRFYKNGEVYFNNDDGGVSIDMISHLPAVAKRIALVVVYGNTVETAVEPRTFLVDAVTRQTEGQEVATESRRQAYIDVVYGTENATPEAPAVNSNYVAVASITLTPAGIEENGILMLAENELISVKDNAEAIDAVEERLDEVGPQLDTMGSAITSLQNGLASKADGEFVNEISVKVNGLLDKVDAIGMTLEVLAAAIRALSTAQPTTPVVSYVDNSIDDTMWDTSHADWNALLQNGLRFPRAATTTVQLALANPLDSLVTVTDNMMVPRKGTPFNVQKTIEIAGEYAMANSPSETIALTKLSRARMARLYRKTEGYVVPGLTYDKPGVDVEALLFKRPGESWSAYDAAKVVAWDIKILMGNTAYVIMRDPYFRRLVSNINWTGSVIAQSFTAPQDGMLRAFYFGVSRKANAGDIQIAFCETDAAGLPLLDSVLETQTLAAADIKQAVPSNWNLQPNYVPFSASVKKGKTYAFVLTTSGAHFVQYNRRTRGSTGAFYYLYEGQWVKDAENRELAHSITFTQYENAVTEVQLEPLALAGGIDTIDINADMWVPDGTNVEFRIKDADGLWKTIGEDPTALATKPALVQFKAILRGTKDVAPMVGLGSKSSVTLTRPGTARVGVTKAISTASTSKIVVRDRHANWNGTYNTETVTLLVGAGYSTVETADSTTTIIDGNDVIFERTFNLAAPRTSFKIKCSASTSDVAYCDTLTAVAYSAYA